ncbi:hypothetical protein CHLNCDRAFT_141444 [Chlorella variabilis]|uniref:Uncharacterized protein n=1 Tax=Chlorella variabilis TaxID=554065 RepID=E1ZSW2_CHLVA|nr:hypothetical protein CHLNCDRAFT_141444 [Chlorella variabilis]EFN51075.1 hypothetical protein CHLNCDRAFT_141444 [Chlorella variabilis]|eukprot:XP_005843177.1 hypothetical protein CHLNCDRAFT_141444 [Chlorella variabilis]
MSAMASILLLAVAILLTSSVAAGEGRQLTCPPSIVKDVPVACSDSGSVLADSNVTYRFLIEAASDPFDLVLTLHTQSGDADLVVDTPGGQRLVSRHGSGEDVVFIPRAKVAAGEYTAAVLGSSEQSSYKLLILDGPCCRRPDSCATLRAGLPPAAPAASGGGAEDAGEGGDASWDLCNTGQNLCDPQGRLLHLALVNEYLSCPFPTEPLAALDRLTLLDLTMNDLTGSLEEDVVPAVRRLPALQNLLLSHNKLGGRLSCDLVTDTLAELGLAANELQGGIPACLVESPAMQELYLAGNSLEGPLPQPPPASKLLIISAHGMRLSGPLPDLSALPQLQALQLQSNALKGALPPLPAAMRHLDLGHNQLRRGMGGGSIPEQWASLPGLEVLRLQHNALTGSLPAGLARQPGLELLLLGDNRLGGALPADWQAPRLQRLDLQHNSLTGTLPAVLGTLPSLTVLQLGGNRLGGGLQVFAAGVAAAAEGGDAGRRRARGPRNRLLLLALAGNRLTGPVPEGLRSLGLFVRGGGFTLVDGVAVPATLDLSNNQLSGPFPAWAAQELADSRAVVVSMEGNSGGSGGGGGGGSLLSCPTADILVPAELKYSRMMGLECLAADGSVQPVAQFVKVGEQPPPGLDPEPQPSGGGGGGGSGGGGSASGAPAPASADSGGGMPAWGIALAVLGGLAGAAALLARARCYKAYEPRSDSPGDSPTAADMVSAKGQAVALADLGSKAGGLPGSLGSKAGDGGGLLGAWGAGIQAVGAAAGGPGAGASAASSAAAFSIGTKVHASDGADLV